MTTPHEPIDRDHPAVKALGAEGFDHEGGTMHAWRCEHPDRYPGYCACPEEAVAIVRDNLTADDLRDTPVGRALMAEGWETGVLYHMGRRYVGGMSPKEVGIIRERIADANPYLDANGAAS